MGYWASGTGALFAASLLAGCLDATQIEVDLSTDVNCADHPETTLSVGTLGQLDASPPVAVTSACDAQTGRIGSIVVLPHDSKQGQVGIEIVTGLTKSADECRRDSFVGGCIVARRSLNFVKHRGLKLPIELEAACVDVPCGVTQTCRKGSCVSAAVADPESCFTVQGCSVVDPAGSAGGSNAAAGSSGSSGSQTDENGGQASGGTGGLVIGTGGQISAGGGGDAAVATAGQTSLGVGGQASAGAEGQASGGTSGQTSAGSGGRPAAGAAGQGSAGGAGQATSGAGGAAGQATSGAGGQTSAGSGGQASPGGAQGSGGQASAGAGGQASAGTGAQTSAGAGGQASAGTGGQASGGAPPLGPVLVASDSKASSGDATTIAPTKAVLPEHPGDLLVAWVCMGSQFGSITPQDSAFWSTYVSGQGKLWLSAQVYCQAFTAKATGGSESHAFSIFPSSPATVQRLEFSGANPTLGSPASGSGFPFTTATTNALSVSRNHSALLYFLGVTGATTLGAIKVGAAAGAVGMLQIVGTSGAVASPLTSGIAIALDQPFGTAPQVSFAPTASGAWISAGGVISPSP